MFVLKQRLRDSFNYFINFFYSECQKMSLNLFTMKVVSANNIPPQSVSIITVNIDQLLSKV